MTDQQDLQTLLSRHGGLVTTRDAAEKGISKQLLSRAVADGRLKRAAQGIYLSPDAFEDGMYLVQLRSDRIIFSHETALYIHDLTDRDPLFYAVTLPRGYPVSRLQASGLQVHTVKPELHELGKTEAKTIHGHTIRVYNPERTVCDLIRKRNQMDADMLNTALRRYAARKDKDIAQLMAYAKAFRVDGALRQTMGVLF